MSDDSIPWLRENTVLLTVAGSMAYGTYTDGSDVDLKGVAIPPLQYFIGMGPNFRFADKPLHIEKFREDLNPDFRARADRTKLEGSIYDLHEFLRLASDCNPNILDVLFCRDEEVVLATSIGQELRTHRKMFLSRVARYRFAGYALSQLRRIMGHHEWLENPPLAAPERSTFGLKPKPEIPSDQLHAVMAQVRKQLDRWSSGFVDDLDEHAKARVKEGIAQFLAELRIGSDTRFIAAARTLGFDENFIEYLKKEREFEAAVKRWKSYLEWKKNRNPERAALEARYGYDCYLDDTEFLTSRGWLRYDEVVDGDTLATLNQSTGHIEYQAFTDRVAKPHTGPVVFLHPQHSNCAVTLNHRMWVSRVHRTEYNGFSTAYTPGSAEWTIRPMGDLLDGRPSYFHVRVTGTPRHTDYPIPDDLLTLMGCYVTEGCVGKSLTDGTPSVLRISQKAGGRLEPHMDGFMSRYPAKVRRFSYLRDEESRNTPCEERVWTVADRQWARDVVTWCGSGSETKHLPPWAVQLSARQVDLLLDVMVAGDGSNRPHSRIYHTSSKRLADDVQAMCVSAGIVSQVWGPYGDADATPMYQVYVGQRKEAVTACFREEGSNHVTVEEVQGGRIVCFTVPNEILVTRRGGKVAIQGNTKHAMHLVRLMDQGRQVLTRGDLDVWTTDRKRLMAVRNGEWEYQALVDWAEREDLEHIALLETSPLPEAPNRKKIDALCQDMIRRHLGI